VACRDLAVDALDEQQVRAAELVVLYVPMHTAARLASAVIPRVKQLNPRAHVCCYGLYAPMNEQYWRTLGVETVLGGEFEAGLVALVERLLRDENTPQREPVVSLERQQFAVPDRSGLPALSSYAHLVLADGTIRLGGYTEASRGCKHTCRHCPIVPVYGGRFRIVQHDVVLEDIAQQVDVGAQHITFGDPDFFNGPRHAIELVEALHTRWPHLTYDVTIKIEHLLKHADVLPVLRATGCVLVTSAVEAVDDAILAKFDKRHSRADFFRAVGLMRDVGLALNPTFVAFTPWTSLERYLDLLHVLVELDLVEHVSPIQYGIRLLIPAGSKLLDLPDVRQLVGRFDEAALCYPWSHPDPAVDRLWEDVMGIVKDGQRYKSSRRAIFQAVVQRASATRPSMGRRLATWLESLRRLPSTPIPHLSEPWYC